MTDAERYNFADFTRENYRRLVALAKTRYRFRTFADFDRTERFVLWRHDVDHSPHAALRMAQIEAEADVVTTYFYHLHSTFYSVLEAPVVEKMRETVALGHAVGLHFDSHFYGIEDIEQLERHLNFEREILQDLLSVPVRVFSFHISTPFTMSCREWEYAGMIHAHAAYFQDDVGYCSDSNGYWRHRRLEDVLQTGADERLQVLTHPAWWQDEAMAPRERLLHCVEGRAAATMDAYDRLLASYGRQNVGSAPATN